MDGAVRREMGIFRRISASHTEICPKVPAKKKTNPKIVRITGCDLCCKRTAGSINSQSVIKKLNSSHTKLFQSTMRLKLPLESPGGG